MRAHHGKWGWMKLDFGRSFRAKRERTTQNQVFNPNRFSSYERFSHGMIDSQDAMILPHIRDILLHVPSSSQVHGLRQQLHLITSANPFFHKSLRECPFPEPWQDDSSESLSSTQLVDHVFCTVNRLLTFLTPRWAFLWPGGYALTKWAAENPAHFVDKRVIDFASGCGSSAIEAARASAANVLANDIDPYAGYLPCVSHNYSFLFLHNPHIDEQ
jgi:2-polyprenyl-3-methyl-5-hydroxy-6-metoxy-1,4-benzoquinol methylase